MFKNRKTALLLAALVIIIAAAVGAWLFLGSKGDSEPNSAQSGSQVSGDGETKSLSQQFYIYDTVVNIKIFGDKVSQKNMDDIQQLLERMDMEFSRTKEGSEVYNVNLAAGKEAVTVSDETLDAVKRSIKYAQEMDGLFDPTIGPLVDLWNIGNGGDHVPPQAEIDKAKSLTNYKDIIIDEKAKTVKLAKEGMVLDLGGIGKGYAADRIAEYLKEQGLDSAMINLGGSSIIGLGTKPGGSQWNIGLQDPDQSRGTQLGTIKISNEVIDASGVYERFFMQDGVRYHHILDPRTGYPGQLGLKSLTIMSPNATDADALSTGVFLMGVEDGLKYLESLPEKVEGFFITEDNKIYATPGIRERLVLTDPTYSFGN
ncbi:FAD:protein FMN transferase [Paenibacillus sp. 7124]|uniref:FAD:protein FMN transferase n=1 Tax=Paenibacillus apii TaxID=1850370 RepID=A0A6M1PJN5_9BACL|nr:FAD:protein FMN transferase [Paenibacillus apii]NGM82578.1 FAD:protein FMN transferase [Paenibacillus apii]NJJ39719.1 FAD:protein FMN transferase [Paenibacillus apii]